MTKTKNASTISTKEDRASMRGRPRQSVVPDASVRGIEISWGWWARVLSSDERLAYARLRQASLNSLQLGQTRMLQALGGGHQRKLAPIYIALEQYGFIRCRNWGRMIPMEVFVNEVPSPPADHRERDKLIASGVRRERGTSGEAAQFISWFAEKWTHYDGRGKGNHAVRYPLAPGKEHGMVARLLNFYSLEELKKIATYFFQRWERPHVIQRFAFTVGGDSFGCR